MKKILLVSILLYSFNIAASEIDWNSTDITSQNYSTFLEEKFDDNSYLQIKNENISNFTYTEIAISSLTNFKKALSSFLSKEEIQSHFVELHTPNAFKIKTLSSLEHIRLRPGMYIGRLGNGSHPDDGIYILLKEVIDNSSLNSTIACNLLCAPKALTRNSTPKKYRC